MTGKAIKIENNPYYLNLKTLFDDWGNNKNLFNLQGYLDLLDSSQP